MKRTLKGFTLAEALITLGIIGVIASISLPNLSINIQKQQAGPALAKAINTLETANRLALQEGNVRTLDQLTDNFHLKYLDNVIGKHVQFQVEKRQKPNYNYNGTSTLAFGTGSTHTTKDGITFYQQAVIQRMDINKIKQLPLGYSGVYITLYIDVNGNRKGPNALGKDLFRVSVDTKGSVIPYGGSAWNTYSGEGILWTGDGCGNRKKAPTNAYSCAGSIADNGYKVIY